MSTPSPRGSSSVTRECLERGIEAVAPGHKISDIGRAIQRHADAAGFGVVRAYCGHGIGEVFHSAPQIPHYYEPSAGTIIEPGMTFTIEPMITLGTWRHVAWDDGWTAVTADGRRTAQFEHTLLVTADGAEVLTRSHNPARAKLGPEVSVDASGFRVRSERGGRRRRAALVRQQPGTLGHRGHRARVGPRRHRRHGGGHRPAEHRARLSQRRGHLAVGRLGLLADAGRLPPSRWLARRPPGAQTHLLHRRRLVRPRLRLLRAGPECRRCSSGPGCSRASAVPSWPRPAWPSSRRRSAHRTARGPSAPGPGSGGLATAAGPLLGGYLIAAGSWRWVFFINVPLTGLVLAVTRRHVPESHDPSTAGHVDAVGAGLAVLFLAGLTYGLIEAPSHGWTSPVVLAGLVLAAVTGPAFLLVEHAIAHPMLPLGLFRTRQFSGANAVTFIVYGALGGALFLLPVELQLVVHYSPLASGLALLPVTGIMLVFSARSGQLAAHIGPRLQMTVGPVVVGAGLLLLTRATHSGSYAVRVLPAVIVFGLGLAITVAPLTAAAMGAAPAEHAGVASAVNNVVARAAGLLAVASSPCWPGSRGPPRSSRTGWPPGSGRP